MHPAMMRIPAFAFFLSISLVSPALALPTAASSTPTTGAVGSAALRNGFPAGGGAVALPSVQNSATTLATPTPGTATSTPATGTTTSTVATGAPGSAPTSSTTGAAGGASTTGTTGGRIGGSSSTVSGGPGVPAATPPRRPPTP